MLKSISQHIRILSVTNWFMNYQTKDKWRTCTPACNVFFCYKSGTTK